MIEESLEINPLFEGQKHGISQEFLAEGSINELQICGVCKNILWDPQMCSNYDSGCFYTVCRPCIRTFENNEICQKCNKETKYSLNKYLHNTIISTLKFKCQNAPKCSLILEYTELPYHYCDFDVIKCKNVECNWKGTRNNLSDHHKECIYELIKCPNTNCKREFPRNNLEEHSKTCEYQILTCPICVEYTSIRKEMPIHTVECPKAKVVCIYQGRGCAYQPTKDGERAHREICLYQPVKIECGHEVNLKDEEVHRGECTEFPMVCEGGCGAEFTRGDLAMHGCIPFLFEQMRNMRVEYHTKITSLENKLADLNQKLTSQEENHVSKISKLEELIPTKCQKCHQFQIKKEFRECAGYQQRICQICLVKCSNPQCNKLFCKCSSSTLKVCVNCQKAYCCRNLQRCEKCGQGACCMTACQACNRICCKCYKFNCADCDNELCKCQIKECPNRCDSDVCIYCVQTTACNKCRTLPQVQIKLIPKMATSTLSSVYELENTLQEGKEKYWQSITYETELRKQDAIEDLKFETIGQTLIGKISIIPQIGAFGFMHVYLGITEGVYPYQYNEVVPCNENIIIEFPLIQAKFIRIKLFGTSNTTMVVFEVKVYGLVITEFEEV